MANLNPAAQALARIKQDKQSNLAVAADLTDANSLVKLVQQVGDSICVLKTHIDVISDFTPDLIQPCWISKNSTTF